MYDDAYRVVDDIYRWSLCTRWRSCCLYLEDLPVLPVSTDQRFAADQHADAAVARTSHKLPSSPYVARFQSFQHTAALCVAVCSSVCPASKAVVPC